MNARQKRFCEEYLIDCNATQAAIRAGYKSDTAYSQGQRMLKKVEVKAYLDQQLETMKSRQIADAEEVMKYLTAVLRGDAQSEIVVIENVGDYMSEARKVQKAPDEKERLKAAELLGKRFGMFTDKVDLQSPIPVVICYDYGDEDEKADGHGAV